MRESALGLAPAKAGKRVSWAGENREVPSLALGFTVPVQRKLPHSKTTEEVTDSVTGFAHPLRFSLVTRSVTRGP